MGAIFELHLQSETLTSEEVACITGCNRKGDQIDWLTTNGWRFYKNRGGDPIVGRLYARMQLAGIQPGSENMGSEQPSFNKIK
jgi:hypothetical protein